MNCKQIQPNLLDYSLGTLTAREATDVREHLAVCEDCRQLLEQEKCLSDRLSASVQPGPQTDVWNAISARIAAKPAKKTLIAWPHLGYGVRRLAAVAAAVVLLAGGTVSVRHYQTTQAHEEEQRVKEAIALIRVQPETTSVESASSTTDVMMDVVREQVPNDEM